MHNYRERRWRRCPRCENCAPFKGRSRTYLLNLSQAITHGRKAAAENGRGEQAAKRTRGEKTQGNLVHKYKRLQVS
jgi:hypothetical protein